MVPASEELSGMGAAYAAGLGAGLYTEEVFSLNRYEQYSPTMDEALRTQKYDGWKAAVNTIL